MFEKIQSKLADYFGVSPDTIKPETSFIQDLKADSLAIMELMFDLESETGISFADDAMDGIKTVGDLSDYLEKNA